MSVPLSSRVGYDHHVSNRCLVSCRCDCVYCGTVVWGAEVLNVCQIDGLLMKQEHEHGKKY